jgi:hypothetical protein
LHSLAAVQVILLYGKTSGIKVGGQFSHLMTGIEDCLLGRGYLRGQVRIVALMPQT